MQLEEQNFLPQLWVEADHRSGRAQWSAKGLVAGRIFGAIGAAAGGALSLGEPFTRFGPWAIAIGFLVALICELLGLSWRPEVAWYDCRALAESVKSVSWRFAVGATPFDITLSTEDAVDLFERRCLDAIDNLRQAERAGWPSPRVTQMMIVLRGSSFEVRRRTYLDARTRRQREWYGTRARQNRRWATGLRCTLLSGEALSVAWALSRIWAGWSSDIAGLLAAIIAAAAAWLGFRQFDDRAAAYALADRELQTQLAELPRVAALQWAARAAAAEEAISREHVMWVSTRQRLPWEVGEI